MSRVARRHKDRIRAPLRSRREEQPIFLAVKDPAPAEPPKTTSLFGRIRAAFSVFWRAFR